MFKTIVVGTDGSANAEAAIRAAVQIASEHGSKLHIVTGVRPMTPEEMRELKASIPEEFWPVLHADYFATDRIARAEAISKSKGVDSTSHVLSSTPAEAILDTAESLGADLVVVGSRGESIAKRMIHGSVSTRVMHHAPCTILVVKDSSHQAG